MNNEAVPLHPAEAVDTFACCLLHPCHRSPQPRPMSDDLFDTIVSLSKQRGFIVQSSEIYGGLSATARWGWS